MHFKKSILLLFALALFKVAVAQNCESSYFANIGAKIETTEYEKNGQIKSITVNTVTDVQKSKGINASFRSVKTDPNGTITDDRIWHYSCNGQGVLLGFGLEDSETKKESTLDYPANMSAGMGLKNKITYVVSKTENGKTGKMTLKIFDRKVVGSERIKVKAGSWDCTKISYKMHFSIKVGLFNLPFDAQVTEWFHPEVGVVRSEVWMKGNKESYSEITSLIK